MLEALHGSPGNAASFEGVLMPVDPYGEDAQLALNVCYELHYRGFTGVDAEWEWSPALLEFRSALERPFLDAMRADATQHDSVTAALDELLVEPVEGAGLSHYLRDHGEWWHMREYIAHRSVYHLKEAEPHSWMIPRLDGRAKVALVAVEYDEFGGGRYEQLHSRLFAHLMKGLDLDSTYGHYLDVVPAPMLAVVSMMSLFGLHRALRGALVGHFAAAEITSAPSARRMERALQRLGAEPKCVYYYTEHVEADAVHEQVLRHDVIADLLRREPELTSDVLFGIEATVLIENLFAEHVLSAWRENHTSLRDPLPDWGTT